MFLKQGNLLKFEYDNNLNKSDKYQTILLSGPPFMNGTPHGGHAFNIVYKDAICKYLRSFGIQISLYHGWDCHGEPVIKKIQTHHNILSNKQIYDNYELFIQYCRNLNNNSKEAFIKIYKKLGIDISYIYSTDDKKYMKHALSKMFEIFKNKKLYNEFRHNHFCFECKSDLSFSELLMQKVECDNIYRLYEITNTQTTNSVKNNKVFVLVYTTTPYTLFFNEGIAFNSKLEYIKLIFNNQIIICLKSLISNIHIDETNITIEPFDISLLKNYLYSDDLILLNNLSFYDEEIVTDKGSGFVHLSSYFSNIDYQILKKHNKFRVRKILNNSYDFLLNDKILTKNELNNLAIQTLQDLKLLFNNKLKIPLTQINEYLICWRCEHKVDSLLKNNYFVDIQEAKIQSIKNIEASYTILPNKAALISMIEMRSTWCFSREKSYGIFLPSWKCEICDNHFIDKKIFKEYINNFTDETTWVKFNFTSPKCPKCKSENTIKEFLISDVWFESGIAFSYASNIDKLIPAIYLEGYDQFRGWFNSTALLESLINHKIQNKIIISSSFLRDELGQKLSKSKGNYKAQMLESNPGDIIRGTFLRQNINDIVVLSDETLQQTASIYIKQRNHLHFLYIHATNDFTIESVMSQCNDYIQYYILFVYHFLTQLDQTWFGISIDNHNTTAYNFALIFKGLNELMFEFNNLFFMSFFSTQRYTNSYHIASTFLLSKLLRKIECFYPFTYQQILQEDEWLNDINHLITNDNELIYQLKQKFHLAEVNQEKKTKSCDYHELYGKKFIFTYILYSKYKITNNSENNFDTSNSFYYLTYDANLKVINITFHKSFKTFNILVGYIEQLFIMIFSKYKVMFH